MNRSKDRNIFLHKESIVEGIHQYTVWTQFQHRETKSLHFYSSHLIIAEPSKSISIYISELTLHCSYLAAYYIFGHEIYIILMCYICTAEYVYMCSIYVQESARNAQRSTLLITHRLTWELLPANCSAPSSIPMACCRGYRSRFLRRFRSDLTRPVLDRSDLKRLKNRLLVRPKSLGSRSLLNDIKMCCYYCFGVRYFRILNIQTGE